MFAAVRRIAFLRMHITLGIRALASKTDDGRSTISDALLSGNAIRAGPTQIYYLSGNGNFHRTVTALGISLAGSGVEYLTQEFFYKQPSIAQL